MADLLIRDVPDDVIRTLEEKARAEGVPLDAYARAVVEGRKPPISPRKKKREDLLALTRRNLARFPAPLTPMSKREMREGMEE